MPFFVHLECVVKDIVKKVLQPHSMCTCSVCVFSTLTAKHTEKQGFQLWKRIP